ncbi:MAG: Hsp70 family protein [Candidatus Cloacimonas sp.]|jgi:actin-like ATPase involved in cell morphogenesis|nr:Hsp70 family protein [Candidatus Cloacimonas sp.]
MNEMGYIGIDFGTSTTLVSKYYLGKLSIINIDHDSQFLESVMELSETISEIDVDADIKKIVLSKGRDAWRKRYDHPERVYYNFKPDIGKKEVSNKLAKIWLKLIFQKIKIRLGDADISKYTYVIGVPAKWCKEERNLLKQLANEAGFTDVHLVPEPIAAVLSSDKLNDADGKDPVSYTLFFDFGGGTLDLSLVKLDKHGVNEFIYTGGNQKLGGRDFDLKIVEYVSNFLEQKGKKFDDQDRINIETQASSLKAELGDNSEHDITVKGERIQFDRTIFKKITKDLIDSISKTLDTFFEELDETPSLAKVRKEDVKDVIKIGGASNLFFIEDLLKNYFGIHLTINKSFCIEEAQFAVVCGLPKYLTDREKYLEEIKPKIKDDYLKIESESIRGIGKLERDKRTYFDRYINETTDKYMKVINDKSLSIEEKCNEKKRISEDMYKKTIDDYGAKIREEITKSDDEMAELLENAVSFASEKWGKLPGRKNEVCPPPIVKVDYPDNFNAKTTFAELIEPVLGLLIPKIYLFKRSLWSSYKAYFSYCMPKKGAKNWEKNGGFFYQVNKEMDFPKWIDIWEDYEKRFSIWEDA